MKNHIERYPGIDNFKVVCDTNQSNQEARELKVDLWLPVEEYRHEITFIVDKCGVTDFKYTRYLRFGGRWFREEQEN